MLLTPYFLMKWLPLEAAIPREPIAEFENSHVMGGAAGIMLFARRRAEQGPHLAKIKSWKSRPVILSILREHRVCDAYLESRLQDH
jgi:hypothetical protein